MQNAIILLCFLLTYIGMAAGRLPWLRVDRTGIALLGVIGLLGFQVATIDDVAGNIDTATLVLLFALMIISAQFAESGFFDQCVEWMMRAIGGPSFLLALTVAVCGLLSAVLSNDILIFGMTPALIAGVRQRGLDPRPFVLAQAAATNAGSAATLIGNPQNVLIGQMADLSFWRFLTACAVPALVGLAAVYLVLLWQWRGRMETIETLPADLPEVPVHAHDRNQTIKGAVALLTMLVFFATSLPRENAALVIAAVLLLSRKYTSRTMIASVDWPLLLLIACLFGVTGVFADTGIPQILSGIWNSAHLVPDNLLVMTPLTLLMSNTIGSTPSVILLMEIWKDPPAGPLYGIALLSTLAGNLLLVGSLSNLIVIERASIYGVRISFAQHARSGIPITILSMGFALFWLASCHFLPVWPGGDG